MEPLVSLVSPGAFKVIIYTVLGGLGLTSIFLVSMLVREIIKKQVW